MPAPDEIEVIAPNFKQRLSGVTSTIIQLIPIQLRMGLKITTLGPGLPEELPHLTFGQLLKLAAPDAPRTLRVWHARRNVEMIGGLLCRHLLGLRLKLLFTSASQRKHKWLSKWLIQQMDAVIATSRKTAAYLEVPHTVVMHGIDTDRFCPPANPSAIKAALGLNPQLQIAGCFGRIRHQKGTDLFVDAMLQLLPQHPNWMAIIAGRTTAEHLTFEHDLRQRIEAAGLQERIRFVGEHKDIHRWYQALSLYVAPQRWEGFGLTPLEAMACGVPVVASDVGAFSELVVTGETGAIVERNDLAAMVSGIQPYLANNSLRTTAGKAALNQVRTNFPLEREARQLIAIYQSLLGQTAQTSTTEVRKAA